MQVHSATFVIGVARWDQLPNDGRPEIALMGRSNVGKSSLVNMVLGRRALARTSADPGKTRQLNFYLVNERYYLVDLPGLGYAKVSKVERAAWVKLLERYLLTREPLRLVLHLMDSRHAPTQIDEEVMEFMGQRAHVYAAVLTKTDKLSKTEAQRAVARAEAALAEHGLASSVIATSAAKGIGKSELAGVMARAWSGAGVEPGT